MKFDFNGSILSDMVSNRPMVEIAKEEGKPDQQIPITVLTVATVAILRNNPTEESKMNMTEKLKRFRLGQKLSKAGQSEDQTCDLESDEVTMIKNSVGAMFGSMIVGQVWDFFENVHANQKKLELVAEPNPS